MKDIEKHIKIKTLLEIIYELYREDVKHGKLRDEIFRDYNKAVGKSAIKSQTFQQPELLFKE
jgi:hypothetical protein